MESQKARLYSCKYIMTACKPVLAVHTLSNGDYSAVSHQNNNHKIKS